MQKLSLVNIEEGNGAHLQTVGSVIGMAAVWMSLFKRILYPVSHSYYRSGAAAGAESVLAQGVYATVLVLTVLALLVLQAHVRTGLPKHRFAVAAAGLCGAVGIALLAYSNAAAFEGSVGIIVGSALAAVYVPVHFVYWLLFALSNGQREVKRGAVASFVLFGIVFLLLTVAGLNTSAVSIACPVISSAMVLVSRSKPASTHDARGEAISDESHRVEEAKAEGVAPDSEAGERIVPAQSDDSEREHVVSSAPVNIDIPDGFADAYGLSGRESELAAYAYRNLSARSISRELFIAESTVYTHLKRIYRKTGVHSKQELIDLIDGWSVE